MPIVVRRLIQLVVVFVVVTFFTVCLISLIPGKPEQVSVIGLLMLVLVLLFRWVQLSFIKKRISTL